MTSLHEDARVRRGMERQLALRQRLLEEGARPIGWKLGLGTPAAMERFGTSAALVGFLLDRGVLASGSACSLDGWAKPVAEPEVAIHIGSDVEPGVDVVAAADAIAGLGAAIELVDLGDMAAVDEILAGDIFHRHVLLGPAQLVAEGGLRGEVRVGESHPRVIEDPFELTGSPAACVAHVATHLGAFGERLRPGEVVIAGSILPAIAVAPGERLRYSLAPLGELEVVFEG
jgi:2-keto-4-pentenoate hydratase